MKLDLGCGNKKTEGFIGVDIVPGENVDIVCDLSKAPWPWEDDTIEQVYSMHLLEHIPGPDRITFFNELYRVMKVAAQAQITTPNWSHACAYGDPSHAWPPMSEWYVLYLHKAWRDAQAPHVPYTCDFDWMIAGSWDEWLNVKNQEFKTFAMQRYVNSYRDLIVTLTKRPPA